MHLGNDVPADMHTMVSAGGMHLGNDVPADMHTIHGASNTHTQAFGRCCIAARQPGWLS